LRDTPVVEVAAGLVQSGQQLAHLFEHRATLGWASPREPGKQVHRPGQRFDQEERIDAPGRHLALAVCQHVRDRHAVPLEPPQQARLPLVSRDDRPSL
jgi:hypothetical protein